MKTTYIILFLSVILFVFFLFGLILTADIYIHRGFMCYDMMCGKPVKLMTDYQV